MIVSNPAMIVTSYTSEEWVLAVIVTTSMECLMM